MSVACESDLLSAVSVLPGGLPVFLDAGCVHVSLM